MTIPNDALAIGLGGNVGDVAATFRRAREALAQLGDVTSAALYRTAAIYPADPAKPVPLHLGPAQPDFLNTAVRVTLAGATPMEVIETVLELERLLGRDRRGEARWGPRPIDLDVLVWGMRQARWPGPPELEVPHPRLVERRFALAPLIDLFGEAALIPGASAPLGALEQRVRTQVVERIAEAW